MAELKSKIKNTKDKIAGKAKVAFGKATGNEETELKGKIQSKKADVKETLDDTKEKIAKKINDMDKDK
ncbi:CsbD family protein [Acetobacterium sp.]|uniref:CsbD family protein n=1 Tax=Acetobacterium sp. TaxID=1872094 RepID=UPI002F408A0E